MVLLTSQGRPLLGGPILVEELCCCCSWSRGITSHIKCKTSRNLILSSPTTVLAANKSVAIFDPQNFRRKNPTVWSWRSLKRFASCQQCAAMEQSSRHCHSPNTSPNICVQTTNDVLDSFRFIRLNGIPRIRALRHVSVRFTQRSDNSNVLAILCECSCIDQYEHLVIRIIMALQNESSSRNETTNSRTILG